MMKWVFCILILSSLAFAAITGNISGVSEAALQESGNAVTLAISLAGVICLWSGMMRVAQKAGITRLLATVFTPILSRVFKGINPNGKAMQYIVLNLTANLLGLGNASTPFGIAAMKEMECEENTGIAASNNMVLFVVMNTASLQIIPTTIIALRLKNNSVAPMEILPAVWIVSSITLFVTIAVTKLLGTVRK